MLEAVAVVIEKFIAPICTRCPFFNTRLQFSSGACMGGIRERQTPNNKTKCCTRAHLCKCVALVHINRESQWNASVWIVLHHLSQPIRTSQASPSHLGFCKQLSDMFTL